MHLHDDGTLSLSPSDVTAFLACEHLTTLELAAARGELARPDVDERAGGPDQAQGRRARARVPRDAPRRAGATSARSSSSGRLGRGAGRDAEQAMRDGVDVVYQAVVLATAAGAGSPTSCSASSSRPSSAPGATRRSTRSSRARAKPVVHPAALFYNEQLARIQGREPDADPRAARLRRAEVVSAGRVRRLLPARAHAARAVRRRPAADRAVAGRPLRDLRLQAALRRALGSSRPPLARRRHPPLADREARGGRHHDARRARRARRPSRRRPGSAQTRGTKIREQAELQLAAREHGQRHATSSCRRSRRAGFALLPDPSPGDLFFDFEGNPFWDADGSLEYLWGILDAERQLHAAARARPRDRARWRSRRSSTSSTSGSTRFPDLHVYHYAQYEITALRRLMGRYGTREDELDDLLRREVFVDLYASSATASARRGPATGSRSSRRSSTSSGRPR